MKQALCSMVVLLCFANALWSDEEVRLPRECWGIKLGSTVAEAKKEVPDLAQRGRRSQWAIDNDIRAYRSETRESGEQLSIHTWRGRIVTIMLIVPVRDGETPIETVARYVPDLAEYDSLKIDRPKQWQDDATTLCYNETDGRLFTINIVDRALREQRLASTRSPAP